MNASRSMARVRFRPACVLLALALGLIFASFAFAQTCDVTTTPSTPVANKTFSLCGPSDPSMSCSWYDSLGNPLGDQRCLDYLNGLAAGVYNWTLIVAGPTGMSICPVQLAIADAPPQLPACDVSIDPSGTLCGGQSFTLCAPLANGVSYAWYENDVQVSTERCLVVPSGRAPGSYAYAVVLTQGTSSSRCAVPVTVADCARRPNCPRPASFWARQCVRFGNRRTQIRPEQMSALAAAVDSRSAYFNWTGSRAANGSLCWMLNPPRPMDARKKARQEFAALLANVCAGDLGIQARNGDEISLDPATPIACEGSSAGTIAALITETDAQLNTLETQSLSDPVVLEAYRRIEGCCSAINHGVGIGVVCPAATAADNDGDGPDRVVASPNPFSSATSIELDVADTGEVVDIGIYDVTGRLVQKLAHGWQPAGTVQLRWDGRDASGSSARAGVFFVRGTIGDRPIAARLMLLR